MKNIVKSAAPLGCQRWRAVLHPQPSIIPVRARKSHPIKRKILSGYQSELVIRLVVICLVVVGFWFSVCLFIYLFVCLFVCLLVCLFICLFVCFRFVGCW
ncbi:hypothetical protein [Paenibacillus eucommiae]|uniref:Flp pilus assembly protein TadB n=1 Tax=Paenibacillus eucommiae TaxID=1355755 RepID=A0ABS4J911_9BACL|nr:hypothetical protein [Paenibacillus eucommiae]MBP1996322.1 Flp pilus assembly protein TadB [Paenibacillus eucommiae]